MAATTIAKQAIYPEYDWAKQVKEFEDTKAGVKGLVDSGITTLPRFLIHPPESVENPPQLHPLELPTVDLEGVLQGGGAAQRREAVVEGIRTAVAEWGFFRVVNHGVPSEVMEGMLAVVRRFHEQRSEDKAEYYSADNNIGGLQVRHKNQWVDVPPLPGTLIANIGDLISYVDETQACILIISNDKFVGVEHRVLAQPIGPRVSVACFFTPISTASAKPFGPIKELLSDENPAIYRECLFSEYYTLPHFKI
ncbi:hypothetical protein Vadar_018728 [Vaccinium darrowii]|uniref:Uncharacterized protein n=1 Tax=Vaccinium darrowii TaxID=229202 RepID=A0ACB7XJL8_9ERIC|nr:hypothetical protein Vadar_018728 [Vaccinium darrowii]